MATEILTVKRLQELYTYDPATGIFMRRIDIHCDKAGTEVGWRNTCGYLQVTIAKKKYRLHRLAWLYMTGEWPTGEVDHINGVRADNRWANLRDVSRTTNQQNKRHAKAVSGFMGAWASGIAKSPYISRIRVDGKQRYIGVFATAELANEAYLRAKRELHEGCTI